MKKKQEIITVVTSGKEWHTKLKKRSNAKISRLAKKLSCSKEEAERIINSDLEDTMQEKDLEEEPKEPSSEIPNENSEDYSNHLAKIAVEAEKTPRSKVVNSVRELLEPSSVEEAIETEIVKWLKSGNENATYIAHIINEKFIVGASLSASREVEVWKLNQIEDTLRSVSNTMKSQSKETCLDRQVCRSWDYVKEIIQSLKK